MIEEEKNPTFRCVFSFWWVLIQHLILNRREFQRGDEKIDLSMRTTCSNVRNKPNAKSLMIKSPCRMQHFYTANRIKLHRHCLFPSHYAPLLPSLFIGSNDFFKYFD